MRTTKGSYGRNSRLLLGLLVGSGLTCTLFASLAQAEASPEVIIEDALTSPARPGDPEDAALNFTLIQDNLFSKQPNDWGGAYVDGEELVVKSISYDEDTAMRLLAEVGVTHGVQVVRADRSIADLQSLSREVWKLAGDTVVAVGPQYSTSTVVVAVLEPSATDETFRDPADLAAIRRIGNGAVKFYAQQGRPQAASRYTDASPFMGGARIFFGSSRVCSSGFAWNAPGAGRFMLSAGHCYTSSSGTFGAVKRKDANGQLNAIGSVTYSSVASYGTVAGRHGDFAVYKLSGDKDNLGKIFVGPYDTKSSRVIKGRLSLPENWQGSNVYTSGAGGSLGNGDGQIQIQWVSLINQTVYYSNSGQTMSNVDVGENDSQCVGGGDSGGAVYQTSGSDNAYGIGIISGDNGQGWGPTNCRNYYTPLHLVASDLGGAIKTG
jgi:hypothetical protein